MHQIYFVPSKLFCVSQLAKGLSLYRTFMHEASVDRLTLLHSERPKLYAVLAFLSAKGLKCWWITEVPDKVKFLG